VNHFKKESCIEKIEHTIMIENSFLQKIKMISAVKVTIQQAHRGGHFDLLGKTMSTDWSSELPSPPRSYRCEQ